MVFPVRVTMARLGATDWKDTMPPGAFVGHAASSKRTIAPVSAFWSDRVNFLLRSAIAFSLRMIASNPQNGRPFRVPLHGLVSRAQADEATNGPTAGTSRRLGG